MGAERMLRLAGCFALAGVILAVALLRAVEVPAGVVPDSVPERREAAASPRSDALARCATLTLPDSACEAIWAAHRRHFLGADDVTQQGAPQDEMKAERP